MKLFFITALTLLLGSCASSSSEHTTSKDSTLAVQDSVIKKMIPITISSKDTLRAYWKKHKVRAVDSLSNNTQWEDTKVHISKHTIECRDTEEETILIIDGGKISLKNQMTINEVREKHDEVDFANNWTEINLYNINGREIIEIELMYVPCSGLACSVTYYLVYDCQTKTHSFFGAFPGLGVAGFYQFNNMSIDFVSQSYQSVGNGKNTYIFQLYSLNNKGTFVKQSDEQGYDYTIQHITFPEDSTQADTFKLHWIN